MKSLLRRVSFLLLLAMVLFYSVAMAGTLTSSTSTTSMSPDELFSRGYQVFLSWKTLGLFSALTVTTKFLVDASRIAPINDYITQHNLRWVRPFLAVGLASFIAAQVAYAKGSSVGAAAAAGALAGMGSVGFHQVLKALREGKAHT